ncbi:DUF6415 family natural product biosynthesis protein [Streptomyces sp. NPDC059740]|uniref:DUF6415 family natural product biosynthesis protein n=1 Tax=Streptomyces sp. NPDC059740 TaxID=3346926 RepID=UPI0036498D70
MEETFRRAAAMGAGRLNHQAVAEVRCQLVAHLAALLEEGRTTAAVMPVGSFDRHRMEIHLDRLLRLRQRPAAPSAGSAYADVRQLVAGCRWLLQQLAGR